MATLFVKKDGSGDAVTIQQAIQIAQVGDVVEIEAGIFDENIDLWKGVTLKGAGQSQTTITGAIRSAISSRTFTWSTGSTTLTASAGSDLSAYQVGRIVSASGIPTNTRIVEKTSNTLKISNATTTAATTARAVSMALQNEASIRVRGTAGVIRDMKVVGFDDPNPAVEFAAIFFRTAGLGSVAANGWEVFNCEVQANGEYALLSESNAAVGNLNIHDCKFTGKTFSGANPASGNQFSVPNVPRQLVVIQSVNTGSNRFVNNRVMGITGGLTSTGVASFNTAVTFEPANSVVTGNVIDGVHGYGYGLRVRNSTSTVENNVNYSIPPNTNSGYLIGATGQQVSGLTVGTNISIDRKMVTASQPAAGQPVTIGMSKQLTKDITKVSSDAVFSNEANWHLVTFVYKKQGSSQRLVSAFKNFDAEKQMKLKAGMAAGDVFELHKIVISKVDRTLLVVKRSEIEDASSYDFSIS